MVAVVRYRFVCSRCSQTVEVNGAMIRALLEHGCVVCGGTVSNRSFAPD